MGYPRIIEKVYREPWAIKPTTHHAIQSSLAARAMMNDVIDIGKVNAFTVGALAVTTAQIEAVLSITLLTLSIFYTIFKLYLMWRDRR